MRRQPKVMPLLTLTAFLTLGVACTSGSDDTAATTPEAAPAGPTEASVDAPLPPGEMDDETAATGTPPAAGQLEPSSHPAAVARPSRPPAAPADGVTPSPTIGGTPDRAPTNDRRDARADAERLESSRPTDARAVRDERRWVELPAGTTLPLRLTTAVASDTSAVEDAVTARVTRDVDVDGDVAVPAGSTLAGRVTYARESGKVKGVAGLTVRFHTLTVGSRAYDIDAEPVRREAASTKGKDAQKIGIGAGAGAVVGGLLGGRKGAAIGAAAGGAGGTGVVLATKGEEVRLPAGTEIDLVLARPVTLDATSSSRGGSN